MTKAYDANMSRKGDAIFETSSGTGKFKVNNKSNNTLNAWFKETSIFPNLDHAFIKRSGSYDVNTTSSGLFYFNSDVGAAHAEGSFRLILAF